MNKCPYCKKIMNIPRCLISNVENYGDNIFHIPCNRCARMVAVYAKRNVVIQDITETAEKISDFPIDIMK